MLLQPILNVAKASRHCNRLSSCDSSTHSFSSSPHRALMCLFHVLHCKPCLVTHDLRSATPRCQPVPVKIEQKLVRTASPLDDTGKRTTGRFLEGVRSMSKLDPPPSQPPIPRIARGDTTSKTSGKLGKRLLDASPEACGPKGSRGPWLPTPFRQAGESWTGRSAQSKTDPSASGKPRGADRRTLLS